MRRLNKKIRSGACLLVRWEGAYVKEPLTFKPLGHDGSPEKAPYESVGWVGYIGHNVVTLFPHVGLNNAGEISHGMGEIVIPLSAIVDVKTI